MATLAVKNLQSPLPFATTDAHPMAASPTPIPIKPLPTTGGGGSSGPVGYPIDSG